jgi:hypothetical protein
MRDRLTSPGLPEAIGEVTASWLSEAMGLAHPGTEIAAVEHAEVIHGSLTKVGLEVTYASNPADLPADLYLKAAFEDHGIPVSVRSEALFYEVARPVVDVVAPVCVYAAHDDEHGVVLMENLLTSGCTMSDPTRSWTVDQVADGLAQLASLHAGWWGEGLVPGIPELEGSNALGAVLMEAGYWESCVEGPTGVHVPVGLRDRVRVGPWVEELWRLDSVRPRCFSHGDAHLGNTYIDATGRAGFLDWGGVKAGHWAREICYFLAGALSINDRRAHEADLLRGYLDALASTGAAPVPRWDDAWLDYRRHLLHGLLWFLCPTQMQPVEIINANVERFGTAATDHEVETLF